MDAGKTKNIVSKIGLEERVANANAEYQTEVSRASGYFLFAWLIYLSLQAINSSNAIFHIYDSFHSIFSQS